MDKHRSKEREICAVICAGNGMKASTIAARLGIDKKEVNQILYRSPLMKELCYRDDSFKWHGIIRQEVPHQGLREICAYYSDVREFLSPSEEEWMERLTEGCSNIGRNLNNTRGLFHSFRDSRDTMRCFFIDLANLTEDNLYNDWEIAFELRLKQAKYVQIFTDVLVITADKVFSLEFKMKKSIDPDEVLQAAKYTPYLEIVFGPSYDVIPVLVLTQAEELFRYVPIGNTDMELPVCSGDMLFTTFDEYLGFLG